MCEIQNGRKLPPEVLTADEVNRLLKACSKRAPTGIRNRALIAVLYRAQLRISEALALRPKDLDRKAGTIRVLHGKGDKARTVAMDEAGWALVDLWQMARSKCGANGRQPLFCTLQRRPMTPAYIRQLFPRLARKAGIDKRVHAHGLRHTGAAEMRAEGVDIGVISRQLGHSSIATTARYLDHIAPQAVIDAVKARKWEPT